MTDILISIPCLQNFVTCTCIMFIKFNIVIFGNPETTLESVSILQASLTSTTTTTTSVSYIHVHAHPFVIYMLTCTCTV